VELLAFLAEAGAYNGKEIFWSHIDGWLGTRPQLQDGAVHLGARAERGGGYTLDDARLGVKLHADRQQRKIAWLRTDTLRYFPLHHDDGQRRRLRCFEQMAQR